MLPTPAINLSVDNMTGINMDIHIRVAPSKPYFLDIGSLSVDTLVGTGLGAGDIIDNCGLL